MPEPTATPSPTTTLKHIFDFIPDGAWNVIYWDIERVIKGDTPEGVRDQFSSRLGERYRLFGVSVESLEEVLMVQTKKGAFHVLKGKIDFDGMRKSVHEWQSIQQEFMGHEVWSGGGLQAALLEDLNYAVVDIYLPGSESLQEAIQTFELGEASNSNSELTRAWRQLPTGWWKQALPTWGNCPFANISCDAMGFSVANGEVAGTLRLTMALLTNNSPFTEEQINSLRNQLSEEEIEVVETEVDGDIVRIDARLQEEQYMLVVHAFLNNSPPQ